MSTNETRTWRFRTCTVTHDPSLRYTETRFDDGAVVQAVPHASDDQLATARRLGYGDDVAAMCFEHEVLHTWLCERFDLPGSPTLDAVAHGQPDGACPVWAQHQEEALVMAFQAYLNGLPATAALDSLVGRGLSLEALRAQAIGMFRTNAPALRLAA